ncbi:MAG: metallophosphoesterase family protein [Acidobacteria bacterium]|jgi:predicted phosphodiesterase|nr:metallophosphoesterase family protein [Acidobacteriota bacterium]
MKIGILSDIHEDGERLREVVAAMEKRGVDEIACLGDIVGFDVLHYRYLSARNASYCLDLVRENCRWVVAGNHDLFAIRKLPDVNGCFPFPENWYELEFVERKQLGRQQVWLFEPQELSALLTGRDRDYLASLPLFLAADVAGVRVLFSHALFPDWSGTLTWRPKNHWDFQPHLQRLKEHGCRLGISGHLHPSGIGIAAARRFDFGRFRTYRIFPDLVQYLCPCTASASSKNGFLVFDSAGMTMEAVALRSSRFRIGRFR